jgi:hypothetical protein
MNGSLPTSGTGLSQQRLARVLTKRPPAHHRASQRRSRTIRLDTSQSRQASSECSSRDARQAQISPQY